MQGQIEEMNGKARERTPVNSPWYIRMKLMGRLTRRFNSARKIRESMPEKFPVFSAKERKRRGGGRGREEGKSELELNRTSFALRRRPPRRRQKQLQT